MKTVYMDYAATTYVKPEVLEEMMPYFTQKFGNPSSFYGISRETKMAIDKARGQVAKALNCDMNEVYFTGGGSESDNWAIKGIAEALQERADLNKKIEQLRSRITSNALMQEGVLPVEDPEQLLKELDECLNQLEKLIIVINKTNMAVVSDGELLSDLLAKRDVLKLRIASFQNTISIASNLCFRSRGDEIRQLSAVDVKALQKKVDALSRDYRILDNRIQAANWTADLIEE